ncbi:hypothetical protein [Streptomyces marincola]|uniref:Uncharacterized protein n=1 Tax=Streptomyces marincola TaxID=2878388 RepID=A0A1W7D119_9ACTN|nr:hypothetical protein [Streptomyces marincola]ARQ70748.1 hypothetical protein CAG99_19585 [Streptomyces marincola]
MRTLFEGELDVSYHQFFVDSRPRPGRGDTEGVDFGERPGLCDASLPGCLQLITGLRFGGVGLRVERHDEAPPYEDGWEDIVEVSFLPATDDVVLMELEGRRDLPPLALDEVSHRVRYCGTGMDAAHRLDMRLDGQPQTDRYLLQFWPAPPAPDRVVKQTSAAAAYWNGLTFKPRPVPERPWKEREAEWREAERRRLERENLLWRGLRPSERMRRLAGRVAPELSRLDRGLVEAIDAADAATHRALARWAARRAYTVAGLAEVDWVAPALAALDCGEPLPAPFYSRHRVWERVLDDERIPKTTAVAFDGRTREVVPQQAAIPALRDASEPDPLRAVVHTLFTAAAAYGADYPALFAEARRAFPALGG